MQVVEVTTVYNKYDIHGDITLQFVTDRQDLLSFKALEKLHPSGGVLL